MQIPIFEAYLKENEELDGISCISIVDEPAMEKEMLVFNKQKKIMQFAIQDEMQHKITSVVIRCNYPIYRVDEENREYYIRFGKEVIEQLSEKYSKDGLLNSVSIQHNGELLSDIVMTEMYIKNVEKGINPIGFEDIEDGSLFCTFKVNNEEIWSRIVNGEFGGLSMEVMLDVKPTEEYVEVEEPVDFWSELLDWLQEDFEKKNFSVSKSQMISAIDKQKVVLIDEGGSTAIEYYPYSVGKKDGKDIAILYNPATGKWTTKYLSDIDKMVTSTVTIGDFDYTDPTYEKIIEDEDLTVTRSVHTLSIDDLIHKRIPTMITYNDEKDKPALGYRQVAVIAHGYTKRGNECIRVMQLFGDSRSVREGEGFIPDYRLLLTKRIQAFKPMVDTAKWGFDVLDSRVNLEGDRSMFPCINHISIKDFE